MGNDRLKSYLLGISLSLSTAGAIIYACAGGDWDDTYLSSFAPEVYVDTSYMPLFYTSDLLFYDNYNRENYYSKISPLENESIKDWQGYLDNRLSFEQIDALMIDREDKKVSEKLYQAMKDGRTVTIDIGQIDIKDPKTRNFIEFLHLAQAVHPYSNDEVYPWYYEDKKPQKPSNPQLARPFEEKDFSIKNDSFLKNRYWFQVMKAYFYNKDYRNVISFFEKTQTDQPKNTLYYRAQSYTAGAYKRTGDIAMANYLFALVFDRLPQMRQSATFSFKGTDEHLFNASLDLAKTTEEKAAVWALLGYYNDEKRAIEEIYQLDPQSPHLDFLLTRLVNIQESSLNNTEMRTVSEYKQELQSALNPKAYTLVQKIADRNNTKQPYLWDLATGYLAMYAGEYRQADRYFDKVAKTAPDTKASKDQLRLLKLLNKLMSYNTINADIEQALYEDMEWLYFDKDQTAYPLRRNYAQNFAKAYISKLYAKESNIVMAELFHPEKAFYYEAENAEAMKAYLSGTHPTAWDRFIRRFYYAKIEDIHYYQGLRKVYNDDIDGGISLIRQSGDLQRNTFYGNPFNGKIRDCNDCDHAARQTVKYTMIDFLLKVKEMKEKIDRNEDVFNNSLLVGNAFYNTTYFGNGRAFYYNPIVDEYGNYLSAFNKQYLMNMEPARKYYQIALEAAENDEQRAKCVYLLAKCERNEFYRDQYYADNDFPFYWDNDLIAFKAWDGFKQLKTKYAHTQYYREVIRECGYFKKYASK